MAAKSRYSPNTESGLIMTTQAANPLVALNSAIGRIDVLSFKACGGQMSIAWKSEVAAGKV